MAESIAAEVLKPVIEPVVKSVVATIKRQFNYLCCFTSNIAALKDEAERLDDATKELQGQVDRARDNVQVIVPAVETWLTDSEKIRDQMNGILNEVPNVESGCLKLSARFSLSKRAKKTADRMEELRGQCKFEAIAQPGPPPAMEGVLLGLAYEFKSRKQIEDGIMKSLRDGEMNMIGICGMGGLGKTTMAKMIMNRALKDHLFDEVVIAVVSQPVDKLKIQLEIGGQLGLKDLKKDTLEENRVQMLRKRLTAGTKRVLLVLDDVWEKLELEDSGIPRDCKDCRILLTSRDHRVLRVMNAEVFGMKELSEEDAWSLFRETVGTYIDDIGLNYVAKEVVKECKGLPIALTTVGAALKDERNEHIWKDTLTQLRKANPTSIPHYIEGVYNHLKVSYNKLESGEAKSVFLLCCLFSEDADIPLDYLTYFCMGLGIFEEDIKNLEDAMNRMYTLTSMLKSRSLLLEGRNEDYFRMHDRRNEDYVRMHDVVRDVCIFIAKQEQYICNNDCTWISSYHQLPTSSGLRFPNVRLLYFTPNEEIKFNDSFIEGIRDLRVMFIKSYSSLPQTTQSLRNLNTLVLDFCWELDTISVVGELINLEILICRRCKWIKELPQEIKGLNRLKLLELRDCSWLQRIGRDIISSLVGLEELKMFGSFNKWEAWDSKERENANARLRELEALTNLRCLEIDIHDTALAVENMRLSSKLERFQIRITGGGKCDYSSQCGNKKMCLEWEGSSCLGDWIEKQLLRDIESLSLIGNGANNVDYMAKSPNIRWLQLGNCNTMKRIGRTSMDETTAFPFIEHLELSYLPQLEEILGGPISSNSFHNLKQLGLFHLRALKQLWKSSSSPVFHNLSIIKINECPCLRNLEQLSIGGKDCLSQLQSLEIRNCKMMEQVFLRNGDDQWRTTKSIFPKLKKVELDNLPNLVALCQGIGVMEFPLLTTMKIEKCPKMIVIGSSNNNNTDTDDNHSSNLFCQPQKVSLGSLKNIIKENIVNTFDCHKIPVSFFNGLEELIISGYEDSMGLFSSSVAANLVSLRILSISECNEMVQVIRDEEEKAVSGDQRTLVFPTLIELLLKDLLKLESFCEWSCDVEFPSLRKVAITGCPNLKSLNLASPNLEDFTTDIPNYLEDGALNVSFDGLKKLGIERIENPLYRYKIRASLFYGLQELTISGKELTFSRPELISGLFTASIAGNLVNVKQLEISGCLFIVKVIEDEKEEEIAVSSDGAQTKTIMFPRLQKLYLKMLIRLESFCEWKCSIEMPSLREVFIEMCRNMKNFTCGHLTTPNLEYVTINNRNFHGEKDLNGAVKKWYLCQQPQVLENDPFSRVLQVGTELLYAFTSNLIDSQIAQQASFCDTDPELTTIPAEEEEGGGSKGEIKEE